MKKNMFKGMRVYLSGPMDFVASRAKEKKYGWRNRVGQFLQSYDVTVLDPWNKPDIRGLYEYGKEDEQSVNARENWTFVPNAEGARTRGECAATFYQTLHIDLRMVDLSDFIIAYCPTNIYSVGTVHEIVVARQESKPVLFVSPKVTFPTLAALEEALKPHPEARKLLDQLKTELPVKENARGIPSLWYMPLVGCENFFDGFGFNIEVYRQKYNWTLGSELDDQEKLYPPQRPLLPYLESIAAGKFPQRWDHGAKTLVPNDDWLLMEQVIRTKNS
jgi:hypothetical protein